MLALALLLPAVGLTIAVLGRLHAPSPKTRATTGAAAWATWSVFVAACAMALSRVVLQDAAIALVAAAGLSGAAFGSFGLGAEVIQTNRAVTLAGIGVVVIVVIGSVALSGLWGSAT